MHDREKTKPELLAEITRLRQRLASLEGDLANISEDGQASTPPVATGGWEARRPLRAASGCVTNETVPVEIAPRAGEGHRDAQWLLDAIPDAIAVTDPDGRIERFNREFSERYGLDEDAIQGKTVVELGVLDGAQWHRIREAVVSRLAAEQTISDLEVMVRHCDGTRLPTLSSFSVVRNSSGQPSGIVCVQKDAAQIKEAERRASEQEQLLQETLDAITESVLLVDRSCVFRAVNRTAAERLGGRAEDMIGVNGTEIGLAAIPPALRETRLAHVHRVLETGKPLRLVDERAGMFFDQTYYPVFDAEGQVSHVAIFAADITARIHAQRELEDARTRYLELMENVSDIIYSTDLDGTMTSVSQAAKLLLGYDCEEIIGTHYRHWVPEDQLPRLEAARQSALNGERTVTEVLLRDRDGQGHRMEISIAPIVTDGRVSGTQGIIRDITKRWQIEQMVRENQERLSGLFNAITEAVLLTDPEGVLLALNETAAQHLGRTSDELVGTRLADVDSETLASDIVKDRLAWINQVVETGQAMRIEDSAGDLIFDHSLYPVLDADGRVRQVAMFSKDVSTQRYVETALRDSETKYRDLVEGIGDVIVSLDYSGAILWVNRIVKDMLGYDVEEVVGRPWKDFILSDWRAAVEAQFRRVLNGVGVRSEAVLVARDGNLVYAEYSAAPVLSEGRVTAIQCVIWDVTQRKRLECKLRDSEERYRTLVENAGEAIATVDDKGVFQFMNTTAACRLGGAPVAFIGKTMWDLFPREIADRQMSRIREVLKTGKGCNSIALSHVLGEMRWYNTTIEPVRDGTGTVVSALVIARDIHEFKRAQDELEAYRERMIRAEQLASVGTLSATMAHELTQPLTVIRLSIQNSLKDLEGIPCAARVVEDLQDGLSEVASVTAIAERFRNFARRSAERVATRVAVSAVAQRVMDLLAESARRSKVALRVENLDGLPPLRIPEKDIEQLVFALVQNAIQAADGQKDAEFRIAGWQGASDIELQFSDTCGGIAQEHLSRVFEPFFTTKPAGEGTGLGLCIVQRVVSDAHGLVQIRTEFGRGTTFVVTLPIPGD